MNFEQEQYAAVLGFIGDYLGDKPAKKIVIANNILSFKPGNYAGNWNIMAPIERGTLTLNSRGDEVILTYEFFMYHLFIYTGLMSVFFPPLLVLSPTNRNALLQSQVIW